MGLSVRSQGAIAARNAVSSVGNRSAPTGGSTVRSALPGTGPQPLVNAYRSRDYPVFVGAEPKREDRAGVLRRALFTDRDGTLNPDLRYLKEAERLDLFRGVGEAISLARDHGYLIVCVTNQSGIDRGLYTREDVERIHRRLNELLRRKRATIDGFYYCPHAPERGCACRKPGTLLFEEARREWNIDFGSSAIIGDRRLDIEAGQKLGLLTALVPNRSRADETATDFAGDTVHPDLVASTFANAVFRILARG
jgi:D-glycero-D-manno-heptose 1,7-bisphosphate phosphatase